LAAVLEPITPTPDSTQTRTDWVDLAKGIGILLVVYGHVARGLHSAQIAFTSDEMYLRLDGLLYSFHMPLFFVLAGLFFTDSLQRRGPRGLMLSKIDTLVYPYLLWTLLQGGLETLLGSLTNHQVHGADLLALWWRPWAQFWFLYALFLVTLVTVLSGAGQSRARMIGLLGVAALARMALDVPVIGPALMAIPPLGFVMGQAVYFVAGSVARPWLVGRDPLPWRWGMGALVVFCAFHALAALSGQAPWSRSLSAGMVPAFSGTLVVIVLCQWLVRWPLPWLRALGTSSMEIFLAHVLVASGTRIALQRGWHLSLGWVFLVVGCAAGLLLPVVLKALTARPPLGQALFRSPWPLERSGTRPGRALA